MPDISITIVNNSQENQSVAIFAAIPGESQHLPTAWAVFKLGGTGGRAQVPFPVDYQVAAGPAWNEGPVNVGNIMPAELGSAWTYSLQGGYPELIRTGSAQPNQIAVTNNSGSAAWVGLAKKDIPYLVVKDVFQNMIVTIQPKDAITIGVVTPLDPGTVLDTPPDGPVVTIDLTGAQVVEATLTKQDGALAWSVTVNGRPVSQS